MQTAEVFVFGNDCACIEQLEGSDEWLFFASVEFTGKQKGRNGSQIPNLASGFCRYFKSPTF